MKVLGKGRLCTLLVLLSFGMLPAACGTESPTGQTVKASAGVATTQTATVGLRACTDCHMIETADWMVSKHANVRPAGDLYSQGVPSLGAIAGQQACIDCHDPQHDSGQLAPNYTGNVPRPVIGCESCHGGGALHVAQGGAGPIGFATTTAMVIGSTSTLQASAQFRTCTSCHELLDPNDPAGSSATTTAAHDPGNIGQLISGGSITGTHFATSATFTSNGTGANLNDITGYAMDYSSETVCTDCHNPHGTADINRDWAQSAHADESAAGAWAHYNWSLTSRVLCERCHTTTGFGNYANALQSGNTNLAEQIRSGNVTMITATTTGWKPEMLKCNGCHSDNRGTLRQPGPYLATYAMTSANNSYYQFPDVGPSNVCILCHSGRSSGDNIKSLSSTGTTTVDFANLSIGQLNGHHATAAATMFRSIGYEFAGRDYEDPVSYRHKYIGSAAAPNTGNSGPCVGCHMYRTGAPASHLFSAVSKSGDTVVSVSSEVCYSCHAGSSSDLAAMVDAERLAFTYALGILNTELTTTNGSGFNLLAKGNVSWLSSWDTDTTGNTTAKNNLGSAFNYNTLNGYDTGEMGAYVHNSKYVRRLIYDTIDWLDDNEMNYSVGTTLEQLCSTATSTCATGMNYLLPNGVLPGAPSERPY